MNYKYRKGTPYFGLYWGQWLWHASGGDPGVAERNAASVECEAFCQGGSSTCLIWIPSPCMWAVGPAQRLPLMRNAAWHTPALPSPTSSWVDWCPHGPWSFGEAEWSVGSTKSAWCWTGGCCSPTARVEVSKLEPVHFNPSTQASYRPSGASQGG